MSQQIGLREELAARTPMRGEMWDDLAQVEIWRDWSVLRAQFEAAVQESFATWIGQNQAHHREQLIFALARFDEGAALVRYFERFDPRIPTAPKRLRLLDVGAGNGGVALALANCRRYSVHTIDIVPNYDLRAQRHALQLPLEPVVASGHHIPFADSSFDIVLLLDTIEHVHRADLLGTEVMRILRPGGLCMITTPARLRHLFGRDPHYGVPGLVLFPNALQRQVVNRVFRRRVRTADGEETLAYDVEHHFWHVDDVAKLFPGPKDVQPLYNEPLRPGSREIRQWWRWKVRKLLWDRILIYKGT